MPEDPDGSAARKVQEIFRTAFGERAERLAGSHPATIVKDAVRDAFLSEKSTEAAEELGFHLADWGSDAAFIVALHLFPERFTAEEIQEASRALAAHVPYHAAGAADLLGFPGADFLDRRDNKANS